MNRYRAYQELKKNPKNIRFERLCIIAEVFGFRYKGGKGSHRIYTKPGIEELLNFQDVDGKAKPYQVKQLIKIIEKYNLVQEVDKDV